MLMPYFSQYVGITLFGITQLSSEMAMLVERTQLKNMSNLWSTHLQFGDKGLTMTDDAGLSLFSTTETDMKNIK